MTNPDNSATTNDVLRVARLARERVASVRVTYKDEGGRGPVTVRESGNDYGLGWLPLAEAQRIAAHYGVTLTIV